jgi:OOP family OmpA-OmpF porin
VTDYLVKAGLPANRFTATGYGNTQPVASNDTDEGKAQNRRIDFLVR